MTTLFSKGTEIEELLLGRPLSAGTLAVIVAAIVVATVLLFCREQGIKLGLRIALITVRIAIILLVVAALCEPTAAIRDAREEKRSLAVLIDASRSMSVRDQRKRPEDIREAAMALGFVPLGKTDDSDETALTLNAKQRNAIAAASRLDLAKSLLLESAAPLLDSLREDLDIRYYAFGQSLEMLGDGNNNVRKEIADIKADKQGTSLADSIR